MGRRTTSYTNLGAAEISGSFEIVGDQRVDPDDDTSRIETFNTTFDALKTAIQDDLEVAPENLDATGATDGQVLLVQSGVPTWATLPSDAGGDVAGPASSTDDRIVTFDGVTGKAIQDSGYTVATLPISTATQTALDAKAAASDVTTALALKAPLASPTFTGTVAGIDKTMVGLGSVDNTADADKPISTATQTALDAKAPAASPTFTGTVTVPDASFANAKLANMATSRIKGRHTSGSGAPEDLTAEQTLEILGAVPMASNTASDVRTGASGDHFFSPANFVGAWAPVDLGAPDDPAIVFDGSAGIVQELDLGQDLEISGAIRCHPGIGYALVVHGHATDEYSVTLTTGAWLIPERIGNSEDDNSAYVGPGETLILQFSKGGPNEMAAVFGFGVYVNPPATAPVILDATVDGITATDPENPVAGSGVGHIFEVEYEAAPGYPTTHSATYAWYVNGVLDGGLTDASEAPAVDGGYRTRITIDNGTSTDTADVYSRNGRMQPYVVATGVLLNDTASQITDGVLTWAGYGAYEAADGDVALWIAAQQNPVDTDLPSGFSYIGPEIPRIDSAVNAAYRTALARKTLTEGDITAGTISGITLRSSSMASLVILRGLAPSGGLQWDGTAARDASAPYLENNSVVANTATATYPCLALVGLTGGHYNTNVKVAVNSGWTDGATTTAGTTNRYGSKWSWQQHASGLVTPGTFAHANTADKHLTACTVLAYGPADA